MAYFRSHVLVSIDPKCIEKGAFELIDAIQDELVRQGPFELIDAIQDELVRQGLVDEIQVLETSRIGDPETEGPDLIVYPEAVHYTNLSTDDVPFLVEEHFLKGRIAEEFTQEVEEFLDEELSAPKSKEVRIVLKNIGEIDPLNIESYIARDGYLALGKVFSEMTPEETIQEILDSGLRGRGGAGFPTGLKWRFIRNAKSDQKFMICNADEGDPGAFANRRVLEGDPHSVIEGMTIGAYASGASQGYIYCRAEYPIAVQTMKTAIEQARSFGLLGEHIMGSDFSFNLEVRMGAGAFVCGEETALMSSIEGKRGEPRPRPPFPAQKGLWDQPTNINNVETYANVPQIILKGAEWFAGFGYKKSKGTKTFSMAGDVKNTGLIEVPFGITLREIIFDVGGGIKDDKKFKAVQTGGPMGGCLPEAFLDLPMDYEAIHAWWTLQGSLWNLPRTKAVENARHAGLEHVVSLRYSPVFAKVMVNLKISTHSGIFATKSMKTVSVD